MVNLLSNALKFTFHGFISIKAETVKEDDELEIQFTERQLNSQRSNDRIVQRPALSDRHTNNIYVRTKFSV